MVRMLLLTAFSLLVFSGCSFKEPEPIINTVYIDRNVSAPMEKPRAYVFSPMYVEFNGSPYYVFTPDEAKVMLMNWYQYQNWAETNYKILLKESKRK